jgi:hypothetical protein
MRHERHGNYFYCRHCDYFARKSNTLSMHITLKHNDNKPHKCPKCPEWFKTVSQRKHHILSKHTESLIKCDHPGCEERFKNKTNYRIHWIRKHDDIKRYMTKFDDEDWKCLSCGKLRPKNTLTYHVVTCSPYSPFSEKYGTIPESDEESDDDDDEPTNEVPMDSENPAFFVPEPALNSHTYSALNLRNEDRCEDKEDKEDKEEEDLPINAIEARLREEKDAEEMIEVLNAFDFSFDKYF